ncbi:hypothetical protein OG21DRAFT_1040616 [Imleria badia]|nr:hypothetical protein OG21DRAFT_1040616 [Imleria badia]
MPFRPRYVDQHHYGLPQREWRTPCKQLLIAWPAQQTSEKMIMHRLVWRLSTPVIVFVNPVSKFITFHLCALDSQCPNKYPYHLTLLHAVHRSASTRVLRSSCGCLSRGNSTKQVTRGMNVLMQCCCWKAVPISWVTGMRIRGGCLDFILFIKRAHVLK